MLADIQHNFFHIRIGLTYWPVLPFQNFFEKFLHKSDMANRNRESFQVRLF